MTLPKPDSAPRAVRALVSLLRKGLEDARTSAWRRKRRTILGRLQRLHEQAPTVELPVQVAVLSDDSKARTLAVPAVHFHRLLATPAPRWSLPPTWQARCYEQVTWPQPETSQLSHQHPFRLFLEITRGRVRPWTLPIHPLDEPWLGPQGKARKARSFLRPHEGPPEPFPRRVATYLVFGDELSEMSLCRWLALLLVQRLLVTTDEEEKLIRAFFAKPDLAWEKPWEQAKMNAYLSCRRNFVQPVGGRPSFPAYWRETIKKEYTAIKTAGDGLYEGFGGQTGEPGFRSFDLAVAGGSDDAFASELDDDGAAMTEEEGLSTVGEVPAAAQITLRGLRRTDPKLHRAMLYRISRGRIQPTDYGGELYLSAAEVDVVDEERQANAVLRAPKRLDDMREEWVIRLASRGLSRASARRKLQRWINQLHLSRDEIEASVTAGRVRRQTKK